MDTFFRTIYTFFRAKLSIFFLVFTLADKHFFPLKKTGLLGSPPHTARAAMSCCASSLAARVSPRLPAVAAGFQRFRCGCRRSPPELRETSRKPRRARKGGKAAPLPARGTGLPCRRAARPLFRLAVDARHALPALTSSTGRCASPVDTPCLFTAIAGAGGSAVNTPAPVLPAGVDRNSLRSMPPCPWSQSAHLVSCSLSSIPD
jgi:hypothetical protein